eukprot:7386238-Prymnesium_polylepis.1
MAGSLACRVLSSITQWYLADVVGKCTTAQPARGTMLSEVDSSATASGSLTILSIAASHSALPTSLIILSIAASHSALPTACGPADKPFAPAAAELSAQSLELIESKAAVMSSSVDGRPRWEKFVRPPCATSFR